MTIAVIGFGDRGRLYATLFAQNGAQVVAVCDSDPRKLKQAQELFDLPSDKLFLSEDEFFRAGRLADLLAICTLDQYHYRHAMKAIPIGYDILLEKPITTDIEKCKDIANAVKQHQSKVYLCYVLRYAPFFIKLRELIASGELGQVASINLTECVAYWHQAHSFVRGNWRNSEESSPMIIAKCCHDLDILYYLVDKEPQAVSSMGNLLFFKPENAPKGATDYCCDCPHAQTCAYNNLNFYADPDQTGWIRKTGWYEGELGDREKMAICLSNKENPYSRCVFHCDNDVVDHQVTNIIFEGGVTAHLTMTAFSKECTRKIRIHCTLGEIEGNMEQNVIHVYPFNGENYDIDLNVVGVRVGHGGGDPLMIESIVRAYQNGESIDRNGIDGAMVSHYLGFAAEESRLNNGALIKLKR